MSLPSYSLEAMLRRYGEKFGREKEQYARKAYPDWKRGRIQPAGKTIEKLIELLPHFLNETQRYDLVRKLRAHHLKRKDLHLSTTPENWRDELKPLVQQLVEHGRQFDLPKVVYEKATWLADGDVAAAQRLLLAIDEEEARLRLSYLEAEFKRIVFLLENVKNTEPVRHRIELPQGSVSVTIGRKPKTLVGKLSVLFGGGRTMDTNDKLVPRAQPGEVIKRPVPGSTLDTALEKLTPEQQKKLADKVADEKVNLGVSAEKADQRHYDSTRDMARAIQAADAVERTTKGDYEVKGTFDTASGRTDIHIKKNNNTVIIVVAIVVGIIIFVLLRR